MNAATYGAIFAVEVAAHSDPGSVCSYPSSYLDTSADCHWSLARLEATAQPVSLGNVFLPQARHYEATTNIEALTGFPG